MGLPWAFFWLLFYRPLSRSNLVTDAEREKINADQAPDPAPGEKTSWAPVLADRRFWAVAVARFFAEPAWQFVNFWIPLYFVARYSLNLKEIAAFAWLPFLVAELGCLAGGFFSPLLMKTGLPLLTARKVAASISAVLMVTMVFAGGASTPLLAILCFCVGAFAHQSLSSTLLTLPADLFPKAVVGSAGGLSGFFGYLGAASATLVIGAVVKYFGWSPWLFVALGLFDVIGIGLLWLLLGAGRRERVGG